jgi:diguanylate cyclase (GGDEF)-like protein
MNLFPRKSRLTIGDNSFAAPHLPIAAANQSTKLLLVDDEPRMLASLRELLSQRHFDIDTASSGAGALACLSDTRYDLILLDLSLEDMDGHHVMDFINHHCIETDVIVISGNVQIDAAIGAMRRGAHDFLRKPFSQQDLFKTIDHVLTLRRLRQSNRDIAYQLELSERTYRYLVDTSPDLIYMVEPEGRFTFVNDRACQMLGYDRRELIGQHYSVLVHHEDFVRARYAFKERRSGDRASRDVELRMTCRSNPAQPENPDNASITVSLNAVGMHLDHAGPGGSKYMGTYGIARDITARKQAEAIILHQAYHDVLTNLPNRLLFKDRLGQAIIQSRRNQTELAAMFIDLDRFKQVNDTLGHDKGDQLLLQVTARLKGCLRKGDTLARQGGDEFTVVLPDLHTRDDARVVADKFLECLNLPFDLGGKEVTISASIGIAVFPHDGETIDELMRRADVAMYHIKEQGKNGQAFYADTMEQGA